MTMMNSVKGFPMNKVKKNLGTKRKINFQEKALHLEKRKIKLMKREADEKVPSRRTLHVSDEYFTFHKKLDDIQRLELRISDQPNPENSNL
jgi:hypothetical protein